MSPALRMRFSVLPPPPNCTRYPPGYPISLVLSIGLRSDTSSPIRDASSSTRTLPPIFGSVRMIWASPRSDSFSRSAPSTTSTSPSMTSHSFGGLPALKSLVYATTHPAGGLAAAGCFSGFALTCACGSPQERMQDRLMQTTSTETRTSKLFLFMISIPFPVVLVHPGQLGQWPARTARRPNAVQTCTERPASGQSISVSDAPFKQRK